MYSPVYYYLDKKGNVMRELNDIAWTLGEPEVTKSSYSTIVDYYTFLIIRDNLYKIYKREITGDNITVFNALGIRSISDPCLKIISPEYHHDGVLSFKEQFSYFFIEYDRNIYIMNLFKNVDVTHTEYVYFIVSVEGIGNKSKECIKLFNNLKKQSLKNSPLKGNIIEIQNKMFTEDILNNIRIKEVPQVKLTDIFFPDEIEFNIQRMIHEIINFSSNKRPLRYLLNGSPGTGKTQIISAIINCTYKKITIIILKGTDYNFNQIFEFCSTFNPCLLVIDDLDFIAQDRNKSNSNSQLNDLLHALDGIYSTSIFLLAATNDKNLVDIAASRPGRFDLILDFGFLNPENYIQLIKRETSDIDIINLFEENILQTLSNKKVTGAFIVNLIKQIKSIKSMKEKLSRKDLVDIISFSFDGFYDANEKTLKKVIGF